MKCRWCAGNEDVDLLGVCFRCRREAEGCDRWTGIALTKDELSAMKDRDYRRLREELGREEHEAFLDRMAKASVE